MALELHSQAIPDSKIHGTNMGPIWGQQDPGWSHAGQWTLLYGIIFPQYFHLVDQSISTIWATNKMTSFILYMYIENIA